MIMQQNKNFIHTDAKLKKCFSLLVWNLHKENQTKAFQKQFHSLVQNYQTDIFLFQEVRYPKKSDFIFKNYSYALAHNIETKKSRFGVLTATQCSFVLAQPLLSSKKELGFLTHKSYLLTQHTIDEETKLTILNLHAINFVNSKTFAHELQEIQKKLLQLKGPLIVAGDFNSWSHKRNKLLISFQNALGLQKLTIQNEKKIKHFLSHKLDHIYYRGIKAKQALAIDTKNISDHNPLYATFELPS